MIDLHISASSMAAALPRKPPAPASAAPIRSGGASGKRRASSALSSPSGRGESRSSAQRERMVGSSFSAASASRRNRA